MYRKVHNLRILACGGDGTVSEWVCASKCDKIILLTNSLWSPFVDVRWMDTYRPACERRERWFSWVIHNTIQMSHVFEEFSDI